jgi:hypothetical protein
MACVPNEETHPSMLAVFRADFGHNKTAYGEEDEKIF